MRSSRGQVTAFIVVGLIVITTVGLAYYIFGKTGEQEASASLEVQQRAERAEKQVDAFVRECLRMASSQGLELLGMQGGVIYTHQEGMFDVGRFKREHLIEPGVRVVPFPDDVVTRYWEFVPKESLNKSVYYPIGESNATFGRRDLVLSESPWEYPWTLFPQLRDEEQNVVIDPLDVCQCSTEVIPSLVRAGGPRSLQEQLEVFSTRRVQSCVGDWGVFREQGINVTPLGSPRTEITFAEDDVLVALTYPLRVSLVAEPYRAEQQDFLVRLPVRFRKLYEFAKRVADRDSLNISFDIVSVSEGSLSVARHRSVAGTRDDMIVVSDQESFLRGVPFELRFARQNRYPGLWWLNRTYLGSFVLCNGTRVSLVGEELLIRNGCKGYQDTLFGDPVPLRINVSDPDEDNVTVELRVDRERFSQSYVIRGEERKAELFMLGGGGGGGFCFSPGGAGGGIVFVQADRIVNRGVISADGQDGADGTWSKGGAYAGGGGAGGSVFLVANEAVVGERLVTARGGRGGWDGFPLNRIRAFYGGQGRIRIDAQSVVGVSVPDAVLPLLGEGQNASNESDAGIIGWEDVVDAPADDIVGGEFTGGDRDVTIAGVRTVNVYAPLSRSVSDGAERVRIAGEVQAFEVGDEVLLVQMQGRNVGAHEFKRVVGIEGSELVLNESLVFGYFVDAENGRAQVVRVPSFGKVRVHGTITAPRWDGVIGGIVAFRAEEVINEGKIDVRGKGYRGGQGSGKCSGLCRKGGLPPGFAGEGFWGVSKRSGFGNFGGGGGADCKHSLEGRGGGYGTAGNILYGQDGRPVQTDVLHAGASYGRFAIEVRANDSELADWSSLDLLVAHLPPVSPEGPDVEATLIERCLTIDTPGWYVLKQSVAAEGDCIRISSPRVALDCGNRTITGADTGTGIRVDGEDVEINGCVVRSFERGIDVMHGSQIVLQENEVRLNKVGIAAVNVSYSVLDQNVACQNEVDMDTDEPLLPTVLVFNTTCDACPAQVKSAAC